MAKWHVFSDKDTLHGLLLEAFPEVEFVFHKYSDEKINMTQLESAEVLIIDHFGMPIRLQKVLENLDLKKHSTLLIGPIEVIETVSFAFDDFLISPYDPIELSLRLRMLVYRKRSSSDDVYQFGNLRFHLTSQRAELVINGFSSELDLTPAEFKIFFVLCKNTGVAQPREKISEVIWGTVENRTNRSIDAHVSNLRRKLLTTEYDIQSIYRSGYVLKQKRASEQEGP